MGKKPKQKKVDQEKIKQQKPSQQPKPIKNEGKNPSITSQDKKSSQLKHQKDDRHTIKNQNQKTQKHSKVDNGDKNEKQRHFTWQEVGKHRHKDDIWVVINENIYDVTKFVDHHPGGIKPITHSAGKNATKVFSDGNHPPNVVSHKLGKWKIGRIQQDSMIGSWQRQTKTGKMDIFCSLVLGIALLGFTIYLAL